MSQSPIPKVRFSSSQIESAYREISIRLHSDEAQRAFKRGICKLQDRLHRIFVQGIRRPSPSQAAEAGERIRGQLDKSAEILNSAVSEASDSLTNAGVHDLGVSCSTPLILAVKVFTPYAKRYLELLGKYDQMILSLEKMAQYGLISTETVLKEKETAKKAVLYVDNLVRDLDNPRCAKSKK